MPLITSVCNDKYLPGMLVFLHSFQRLNPEWTYPFKVYHRNDLCEKSKDTLRKVRASLEFEKIENPKFLGKDAHYMCLLPFRETEQDKVIFIDCDILCLGNLDGLLKTEMGFAACLDYEFTWPKRDHVRNIPGLLRRFAYFNTGVYVLQNECLDSDLYTRLTDKIEENLQDRSKGKNKLWDQDIINDVLRHHDSEILPFTYNARKNLFKRGADPVELGVKALHYTGGAKPWRTEKNGFLPLTGKYARYKRIHDLWHKEKEHFIKQFGFNPMEET